MKIVHAFFAAFFASALASCDATPFVAGGDETDDSRMDTCLYAKITDDAAPASSALKLEFGESTEGAVAFSVWAGGPENWNGPIAVELLDANGPICSVEFAGNGIKPCGVFLVNSATAFRAVVNPSSDAPRGVSLALMGVEE